MSDTNNTPLLERLPNISQNERNRDQLRVSYKEEKDVYLLPKAPALTVHSITDDFGTEYERGVDYEILTNSDDDPEEVDWSIGGESPDNNTDFIVDETFETILSRYAKAHDEEFDFYDHEIEDAISGRHVGTATNQELDEIGKLFGPLGRRAGRSCQDYRLYLQSIVRSFNGRGTVPGLIFAVASSLGAETDSIEIVEDFENLEYDIIVSEWPEHSGSNIEALADLADPSVVNLDLIRYQFEDEMGVGDAIDVTVNELIEEVMGADDVTEINSNLLTITDSMLSDDVVSINENLETVDDEMAADDTTTTESRDINTARWEEQTETTTVEWDFFEWTEIIDLGTKTFSESIEMNDGASLQAKAAVIADALTVDDDASVQPKAATTSDTAGVDDTGGVTSNATTVSESSTVTDAATVTETSVAWNLGDWNSMEWARAQ